MLANSFTCNLPTTTSYKVESLRQSDIFGTPSLILDLDDPDGSLRSALILVPTLIPRISFNVSDARKGFEYTDASILIEEHNGDGSVSLMLTADRGNIRSVPVEASV